MSDNPDPGGDQRREDSVYGREHETPDRLLKDLARAPVVPEASLAGPAGWRHHGRLTGAEFEVVQDISNGLTNQMIAEVRGKSVHTVKRQVQSAMSAMNAKTRAHLVAIAFRAGLIT